MQENHKYFEITLRISWNFFIFFNYIIYYYYYYYIKYKLDWPEPSRVGLGQQRPNRPVPAFLWAGLAQPSGPDPVGLG
jgi:hypothetical protein